MSNKNLSSPKSVNELLEKHNLKAKKSLGQNFLIDGNTLRRIAECAALDKKDSVLEVGTGLGTLTEELAQRAGNVVSFEIDRRLEIVHKETLSQYENLTLVYEDFLKTDRTSFFAEDKKIKVVANLPYYITSQILAKLLEHSERIESITALVQKEMAERILGEDRSALSVFIEYYAQAEKCFNVSPTVFYPMPKVKSQLIKLTIREKTPDLGGDFFSLIRNAFSMKRKTLINNLLKSGDFEKREQAETLIKSLGLSIDVRAEALTLENFISIYKNIQKKIK